MSKNYVPVDNIPPKIIEFLWNEGFEGVLLYVPRKDETRFKTMTALLLAYMEDKYESNGRTFLGPEGNINRRKRLPLGKASEILGCGDKKARTPWRRAVERWNHWFRSKETPLRAEMLINAPKISQSEVFMAYFAARRAVRTGADPREEARKALPHSKTSGPALEVITDAANASVKNGPLWKSERKALAASAPLMPGKANNAPRDKEEADGADIF